ncbi:hypothetical protein [Rhodosalinus sp. 5P4]|uniref:hypothetical protein n=1 Tax=Rhodosalinus sp. 5P4 TaxID=3239196 RepID=UPI00352482D2
MIRRAATRWRGAGRALLAGALAALLWSPGPARAEAAELSIPLARGLAEAAVRAGDVALATQMARALLDADPEDDFAHYVLAHAARAEDRPRAARRAAVRAFRYARSDGRRFEAAQMAARGALDARQFTVAQYWLRRATDAAPTDQARDVATRDFRAVRRMNPFNFQLRFSVSPSSNVNNGAEDALNVIDGVPVVGLLSPDALALSGVETTVDLRTRFRLHETARQRTELTGRAYLRRVALSDEAKRKAPMASNGDYALNVLEAGLRHDMALGPAAGMLRLSGALGDMAYAGDPYLDFARLTLAHVKPVADRGRLHYGLGLEARRYDRAADRPERIADLFMGYRHALASGDSLDFGVSLRANDVDSTTLLSRGITARLGYDFGRAFGPVTLSAAIAASYTDYPDYRVATIRVPGGRQDESLAATFDIAFQDIQHAGFLPVVSLKAERTLSNVSRFETDSVSVSFGIRSAF